MKTDPSQRIPMPARAPDLVAELLGAPEDAEIVACLVDDLAPIAPGASVRRRMLEATRAPGRPYRFAEAIAAMVDVTVDKARELLDRVTDTSRWEQNLFPGLDALWVEGGPAAAQCIRGFVRLAAGAGFPDHEHLGDEATLVLEGAMIESGGERVRPGETLVLAQGSRHSYRAAAGGTDLLYFVVVRGGIDIEGVGALHHRDGEL